MTPATTIPKRMVKFNTEVYNVVVVFSKVRYSPNVGHIRTIRLINPINSLSINFPLLDPFEYNMIHVTILRLNFSFDLNAATSQPLLDLILDKFVSEYPPEGGLKKKRGMEGGWWGDLHRSTGSGRSRSVSRVLCCMTRKFGRGDIAFIRIILLNSRPDEMSVSISLQEINTNEVKLDLHSHCLVGIGIIPLQSCCRFIETRE